MRGAACRLAELGERYIFFSSSEGVACRVPLPHLSEVRQWKPVPQAKLSPVVEAL